MELFTKVLAEKSDIIISLADRVTIIGSCFADSIGRRMEAAGFNVAVNPFGTLYNPSSIASAIERLDSGMPYTEADCVEMGAGAGLVCSFEHHTSFARADREEFLGNANAELEKDSRFWKSCSKVIISLGTAFVWKKDGVTVSNCLKRKASEFTHELMDVDEVRNTLRKIVEGHPDKEFIFTVSPVRYLGGGAHSNTLSKSILHLALDGVGSNRGTDYFPAFEILNDELRDYRFYAEDLIHPNATAVEIIWEKFIGAYVPDSDLEALKANEKAFRRSQHRPMH